MSKAKTPVATAANETAQFGENAARVLIGDGGEWHLSATQDQPTLTTNQGVPIADNQNSLRSHPRGATLLEDFILREKITHFDHERIPERVVHARGSGAHGFFELTESLEKFTTAKILTEVGIQTPLFARLSTVAGGAGSEQAHIASTLVLELSKVEHPHIRAAIVGRLRHIEEDLAQRVGSGFGMSELPPAPTAAVAVQESEPSLALQLIGKMKDTLEGRVLGILVADGSDAASIEAVKQAVIAEDAKVKIIATTIAEAKLADGSLLKIDGQLAGTPSVLFDAVAIILSDQGASWSLGKEAAAIEFVRDAFGHLKAIGFDQGGAALLKTANIEEDAGVVNIDSWDRFIAVSKTRQWDREASLRTLP